MKRVLFAFILFILLCGIAHADDYYFYPRGATTNTPSRTIHRYSVSSVQEAKKLSAAKGDTEPFILCSTFFGEEQFYYRGHMVREEDLAALSRKEYESSFEYKEKQVKQQKETQKNEAMSNVILVAAIIFLILASIGIWAGWTDRAVFFHSMPDVVLSFLMIIVIPIGLAIIWQHDNNRIPLWGRHLITWPILSGALIYQIYRSVQYASNKFIGICVFFGRLLVSITGILVIFSRPMKKKGDTYGHQSATDTIVWLALIGIFAAFFRRLVNKGRIEDRILGEALRPMSNR